MKQGSITAWSLIGRDGKSSVGKLCPVKKWEEVLGRVGHMVTVGQMSHKSISSPCSFKCGSIAQETFQPLAAPVKPGEAGRGKSWTRLLFFQLCRQACTRDQVVLHHVLKKWLEGGEYYCFAEDACVQLVGGVSVSEQGEGARQGFVTHRAGQEVGGGQS